LFKVKAGICPLCRTKSGIFYENARQLYYHCNTCGGVFLSKNYYLPKDEEREKYLEHNNDVKDPDYQRFVMPLVRAVVENFSPEKHSGLDFGAGTGPVISKLLEEKGFKIAKYDPFFHPKRRTLRRKYDFIVSSEVVEHFHRPDKEFLRLFGLLRKGGRLICQTHLYSPNIAFDNWYYKNDPTHVFIYQRKTFRWIKEKFNFAGLEINGNLIILSK
jgi:SAM-dependent methyltransferase